MADESTEERKDRNCNSSLDKKRDRPQSSSGDENKKTKSNKRKSRKRSYSDSNTSSSTSSSNSKKRLEKKAKRKKRRSSSSESSSSDSDDKHSDSRTKQRKKEKKETKTKFRHKQKKKKVKKEKKKKKKEQKGKEQALDQNKYGKYGIISECDLFIKQQEFYCWLLEVKKQNPETLPKFETRKMFESYMEDYNTATFPHKKYYDLEKWEAKRQHNTELKALKKARESSFTIADDEKRHDMLHHRVGNKYAGPSRQQLLEMQQELRRRQDEEYRKKAGLT